MKNTWSLVVGGIIGFILIIFVFALILAIPTWLLWNWLMPNIFGLTTITLLQALGINLLAGMLFKHSGKIETWRA